MQLLKAVCVHRFHYAPPFPFPPPPRPYNSRLFHTSYQCFPQLNLSSNHLYSAGPGLYCAAYSPPQLWPVLRLLLGPTLTISCLRGVFTSTHKMQRGRDSMTKIKHLRPQWFVLLLRLLLWSAEGRYWKHEVPIHNQAILLLVPLYKKTSRSLSVFCRLIITNYVEEKGKFIH